MTVSINIGKFNAKIEQNSIGGRRHREVELDVMWHSCGVYDVSYYRPQDAKSHFLAKDWYPPNTQVGFTPEQFAKVVELYPIATKNKRSECYKPFYEDYDLSRGMFDFGDDRLFQVYIDPLPDCQKLYMVNHSFVCGSPTTQTSVLGLYFEDFNRLKDLLDSKKNEIFYSGCKVVL